MWIIIDGHEYLPDMMKSGLSPSTIKRVVARVLYDEFDVDTVYHKPTIPPHVNSAWLNEIKSHLYIVGRWIQDFRRQRPGVEIELDVEQSGYDLIIGLGAKGPWYYTRINSDNNRNQL